MVGLILLAGGVGVAYHYQGQAPDLPTDVVRMEQFSDYVQVRGELKALKSTAMTAPARAGDLQIIKLVKSGTLVKKGDVVVQLDISNLDQLLSMHRSALRQSESEIQRTLAQGKMQEEQNLTTVMQRQYDVERARLEASKQEILSKIEGEKNKLLLQNTEYKLAEVEQKVKSDQEGFDADVRARKHSRASDEYEVKENEQRIAEMTLRAPIDGMVTILPNFRNRSGFGRGSNAPEFKEGDKAYSGANIAELPDLSTLRVTARIDETDRGRVKIEDFAWVNVEALPDRELEGTVAEISTLARTDFSSFPPQKNFDIVIILNQLDSRLRPGMTANVRVLVEKVPNSLLIKPEALFQRANRYVVFVQERKRFAPRVVEVKRRTKEVLVIAGNVKPGERIALKDPESGEVRK